ncbi:MAG: WG repeat-containing protein [Tannerellaceae bacterium]|nr:WG repeat-containing protein [Tannerellaceae bacterium]
MDLKGLLAVEEKKKVSFFDYEGRFLSSMEGTYVMSGWFEEGFVPWGNKKRYGFMDTTGRMVIEPAFEYRDLGEFEDDKFLIGGFFAGGLAVVKSGGKWGVIDKTGEYVLPCDYTDIHRVTKYNELLAVAGADHLFALFSPERGFLSDFECTTISFARADELIHCRKGTLTGLIDRNGKEVVACEYDVLRILNDSIARVELNYKHGLVDLKTGELLTPVLYDMMIATDYPYYSVFCGMERGVIDRRGNEIFPCGDAHVTPAGDGLFVIREGKQEKLIDQAGETLIPLQDGHIEPWMNDLFWIIK